MKKVAIIGAGMAGLSASIRLAKLGYEVSVYESNAHTGGKVAEITGNGFRFDAGPSLFTLPHLVDELSLLANQPSQNSFEYQKLNTICKYFYPDDTEFEASSNPNQFAQTLENVLGEDKKQILKFLDQSRILYDSTKDVFLESSLHKIKTFFSFKAIKALIHISLRDLLIPMAKRNIKTFKNPKTAQLFNRYATYNGSNPYKCPSLFNLIPHLEYNLGAYFPRGGMFAISKHLTKIAEDLGVKFMFNTQVEEILVLKNQAVGIKIGEERIQFDYVVSNSDIGFTYKNLLKGIKSPQKILNQPKSSSGLVFYWGIKGEFPNLDLHNIFFSSDYKAEFEAIFEQKIIPNDPTVYINISSKKNPNDAPEKHENWFLMINVPHNQGQDWEKLIAEARKNILHKISTTLMTDISKRIVFEKILSPIEIEKQTFSIQGALYGNSSNNPFSAFFRHANFSSKMKNLYFCGGSVHPGGGIPLSLLSGKIVSELIGGKL